MGSGLQRGGPGGHSALRTLTSGFQDSHLGSLFPQSLTVSLSIKAFQQTLSSPCITLGPPHLGASCSVLGFPCLHLSSLWPGQSSPMCLAVGYAFGKKKMAGIVTPCLISEVKIDSLHVEKPEAKKVQSNISSLSSGRNTWNCRLTISEATVQFRGFRNNVRDLTCGFGSCQSPRDPAQKLRVHLVHHL